MNAPGSRPPAGTPVTAAGSDDHADDFSTLFELLPIGAYRSAADGRPLRANPALAALNGYADEAEMIRNVVDLGRQWYVDPQRRERFLSLLRTEGRVIGLESEVVRLNTRERIWVSETAHAVRAADGTMRYYEGTVEDITERVRAREALRASQAHLNQIMDLVPGMVYRVELLPGRGRRATFVSAGARGLFGVAPEAMLDDGLLMHRLRHPEDRDRVEAETRAANESHRPLHLEYRVRLDDGTEKWVLVHSAAAPPENGTEVRVGVIFDITARKQAEQALLDNSQLWKRALESIGDGVWDWQVQEGLGVTSSQTKALYGYGPDELPDGPEAFDALTHPDDRAAMQQARDDHFAGRTPVYANEHRMRCKDGQWKWILSRGIVIARGADGRPLRMVGTHTDITAAKQAAALRSERDRAAAADVAKSQFLSRVSHELRTPLNAILGFTQLLALEGSLGERQRGWVGQVLRSGEHLLALVDDVLDLSSAQTGQLSVNIETLSVRSVIDEVLQMLGGAAHEAGVALGGDAGAAALALRGDRRRVKQVLSNLVSNAIKYNRGGGWVRVSVRATEATLAIAVADDGPGLDADQRARLFQPFERAGAQRGPVAGTGLGLALSRQLAEAMGGELDVVSEPGTGSVFTLRLPRG